MKPITQAHDNQLVPGMFGEYVESYITLEHHKIIRLALTDL